MDDTVRGQSPQGQEDAGKTTARALSADHSSSASDKPTTTAASRRWRIVRVGMEFSKLTDELSDASFSGLLELLRKLRAQRRARAKCESPIEEAMLFALFECGIEPAYDAGPVGSIGVIRESGLALFAQRDVAVDGRRYRLDFAVEHPGGARIAVECDGHDFHERTKEQAAHDRSRDRALTLAGWTVLRFTGSEIHADAAACATQVIDAARAAVAPKFGERPKF